MTAPLDKSFTCPVLIGRIAECALLHSQIGLASGGQGQATLIRGEAGIGKSRLVARAMESAIAQGFLTLRGCCFQEDSAYPYAPVLDLLRAYFTDHSGASLVPERDLRIGELLQLLPDLSLLFPHIAISSMPQTLDHEQQKRRLLTFLTHLLTSLAARRPLLLTIEDLHWCDESSLNVLLHLLRQCQQQAIVFLFTYRGEDTPPHVSHWLAQLDREHLATELVLQRLTRSEVGAMLQAIFSVSHRVDVGLLDTIYPLTEGNPFFVEEMLKSLATAGELRQVDGRWERVTEHHGAANTGLIPRSIHDIVTQRAARLSAAAQKLLILAAVAGQRFDFAVLQQALRSEEGRLIPLIKELVAAQFVIEESADQFVFRHALIQQAIYSSLLARERRLLHLMIAEALESLYDSPSLQEVYLAELSSHYYAAGVWPKALYYEQRAGEKALALYAPRAAVEHLTRALNAAHQLHLEPPGNMYYARGQAYETLGEFDRAQSDYEHALDAAQAESNGAVQWRCMIALGFLLAKHDYTQTGVWFNRASDLAERLADPILQAHSLNRLGNWLGNTGQIERGIAAHQEALVIFQHQQDTQGMAESLDLLGTMHGMRGDRIKAIEQLEQAITLFRTLGDIPGLMSSLAMRALLSMPGANETTQCPQRTPDECVRDASESLRLACQTDASAGQAFAEIALAHTQLSFGEFGAAFSHAQAGLRITAEIEHHQWMISAYYALGHIYLLLLAPDDALKALDIGASLAQKLGSTFWSATLAARQGLAYVIKHDLPAAQATLRAIMPPEQHPRTIVERDIALAWGEFALAQGDPDMALQIADHLLASVPGQSTQPIPHLLKLKGEALMALSRLDEAVTALEDARRGARERYARPVLWKIHCSLGQAYQRLHRKDEARQEFAAGQQLIQELAATLQDAQHVSLSRRFVQAALTNVPKQKSPTPREVARSIYGGLTVREREVAALLAHGKTSREIADVLVVSERTAEAHVGNILKKLGFASRTQVAVWAVEKGLVQQ